ncbi:hypothetical protein COU56_04180 [Candidatus Pacearchaeota archaeon CG10_big_fil_rev_8_21_14_0_10_31_9]|nr:MAG: hypothetical protein AUJ62_02500 [Candidatus Pacearchaeota archaeon CG1_02_32_21]PIN92688.1 MAG: hypothetical protein COU56_04180 [Candidatus Pacearchaeota archaeon CG10_big_fil_rev_8_21_14_0_10_31_9]PIZ83085.1 MAG: hypothetical protein COX97_01675 [Candidatus Pacearchaeota archaeon CG_4_10_14_0_2_um_filter_05_32_18]
MKKPKSDKEFEKLFKEDHFRVTIFGSARIKRGGPEYKVVYELAKMIGERGMDIVTGGGPGIMDAANTGHKEGSKKSDANSIGLGIKLPHEQAFNKSVGYKKTFTRFSHRLDNFMLLSNVVVVAPGGVGTLLELFYTWQLMQVKHICNLPIILLGDVWPGFLSWLNNSPLKKGFFKKKDLDLLYHAKNYKEAVKIIDMAYAEYKKGNKDFCINYRKYKG